MYIEAWKKEETNQKELIKILPKINSTSLFEENFLNKNLFSRRSFHSIIEDLY